MNDDMHIESNASPARPSTSLLGAIQEFHRLRSRYWRKGGLPPRDERRLRDLFDMFEPVRVQGRTLARERLELPVSRHGVVSSKSANIDVEVVRIGLWDVAIESPEPLRRGEDMTLRIAGPLGRVLYRFHAKVFRLARDGRRALLRIRLPVDQQ